MTVIAFPASAEGKRQRRLHPSEESLRERGVPVDPFTMARHVAPPWRKGCLPWCPTCWPNQYATQHALHRSDRP